MYSCMVFDAFDTFSFVSFLSQRIIVKVLSWTQQISVCLDYTISLCSTFGNRSSFSFGEHMPAWGQASHPQLKMFTFSKIRVKRTGRKHRRESMAAEAPLKEQGILAPHRVSPAQDSSPEKRNPCKI